MKKVCWRHSRETHRAKTFHGLVKNMMESNETYMKNNDNPNVRDFMNVISQRCASFEVKVNRNNPKLFIRDLLKYQILKKLN